MIDKVLIYCTSKDDSYRLKEVLESLLIKWNTENPLCYN